MPAPDNILKLIDQFHSQLTSYRSLQYNEAQVRNEFIEPFFSALGWDVYNQDGNAYAYKDVIYEDSIKVAGATKAPDYAFRIGGTRKFFVEAKKPSVNLKDEITPAYQLRRYAWSAKLPLSILTDFEEFAVYDCRPKPDKTDKASTGRLLMLTYLDYSTRWKDVYDIFSKDAVLKGSFDQYAETATGKHGTAEVDDAFLAEIERWRDLLAHNIALRNPTLSQRDLNYAIQMTIDRLIFLRICEDRGIEFYGQLQSLLNGGDTYARLCQLFHKADERYNSGLFHFHTERDQNDTPDTLTTSLRLDDKPLKDILGNLYYPDSPYAFSVLPADILGQVYERFLGKVIRLTSGHHAVVEDKPEVKKAGGVFYTPTFIVEYIVKNTLGKLLEGKTPGQEGLGKGTPIRVLDMSCGSGSFLLGAYQYLLDWYQNGYSKEPEKWSKGASPRLYQGTSPDGAQWKLTTSERKRILLDHIYGVDIDSQAVEVTKLSLLLKVLEGESEESIGKQLSMFRERALPDLASNIKCGNSLIGPDFYTSQPSKQGTLPGLDQEEQFRINAFDWHEEFASVFSSSGGFDVIIGNPPYVRSINLKENNPILWNIYRSSYKVASEKEWDIYLIFVEKGINTLNHGGKLGFILPNKFLNSQVGSNLRSILSVERWVREIVHFGSFQIFHGVTTYTCLLFLGQEDQKSAVKVSRYIGQVAKSTAMLLLPDKAAEFWKIYEMPEAMLTKAPWELARSSPELLDKLKKWPELRSIAQIFQGTGTRADKVFLLEDRGVEGNLVQVYSHETNKEYLIEPNFLKKAIRGRDIGRYKVTDKFWWLIVPYKIENGKGTLVPFNDLLELAPRTVNYLRECKPRLDEREKGRFKGEYWYCFGRPQNLGRFEVADKIVLPDVVNRGECCLDSAGIWLLDTAYALDPISSNNLNIRYILGILNSSILTHFLRETGTALRGGYFRMKTAYLNPFPIRTINFSDRIDVKYHDQMVSLVEHMLSLHQQLASSNTPNEKTLLQRQIETTDHQIDALVYELYGLTDEEIKIVEAG